LPTHSPSTIPGKQNARGSPQTSERGTHASTADKLRRGIRGGKRGKASPFQAHESPYRPRFIGDSCQRRIRQKPALSSTSNRKPVVRQSADASTPPKSTVRASPQAWRSYHRDLMRTRRAAARRPTPSRWRTPMQRRPSPATAATSPTKSATIPRRPGRSPWRRRSGRTERLSLG
jgi:hypothetical protein